MINVGINKQWRFVHRRANGLYVGRIDKIYSWDCSRAENEKGSFSMAIPPDYLNEFFVDDIIEFYRSFDGGKTYYLEGDTAWFVRDADYVFDNGMEMITLSGHDSLGLLERRIVAWWATATNTEGLNTYGHKSEPVDAVLWDLFNENFGAGVVGASSADVPPSAGGPTAVGVYLAAAPTDRQMVRINYGEQTFNGPVVNLDCSWKNVLSSMKDAVNATASLGTRVFFDITYNPALTIPFVFKVWFDQRGTDRTIISHPVIFSLENENVAKISMKRIYSDEVTWAHVGGAGQGSLRVTQGVITDSSSFKRSPFYPIESFVDRTKDTDYDTLKSWGDAELYKHRARFVVSAEARDSAWTMYGRDYGYGDLVLAKHRGISSVFRVAKVRISLNDGQETLSVPLESHEDLSLMQGRLNPQIDVSETVTTAQTTTMVRT